MSGEEMEISMDMGGGHGLMEDIDIDFEFANAQQDEDLELGDYNQAEEFQHFNSDNRDELMAEHDDASYGMVDTDDFTYNETAAAANDYDIVIGDTDVYSWQEHDVADGYEENAIVDTGHDNLGATEVIELDADVTNDAEVSMHAQAVHSPTPESSYHAQDEDIAEPTQQTDVVVDMPAVAMANISAEVVPNDAENKQTSSSRDEADVAQNGSGAEARVDPENATEEPQGGQQGNPDTLQEAFQTNSEDLLATGDADLVAENQFPDSAVAGDAPADESREAPSNVDAEDEIGYDQDDEADPDDTKISAAPADLEAEGHDADEEEDIEEQDDKEEAEEEAQADVNEGDAVLISGDADVSVDEDQLADDTYESLDEPSVEELEEDGEDKASMVPADRPEPAVASPTDSGDRDGTHVEPAPQVPSRHTTRHVVVVRYGETDYQLVADKPDDDPSDYFFKDSSALNLPLGEFLAGIRGVISDEVSPLDELVLHIDGLGLEFSESMASQILDAYTFEHILSLYDTLIQNEANEEVVDAPELYMYLMVRPNCLQRLMALQVQAASGRTLADVAVYRETSPAPEAGDIANDTEALGVSPDYAEEDFYDDHGQSGEHADSPEYEEVVHESTSDEAQARQHGDDFVEVAEDSGDNDPENNVDYGNLDVSPSHQGNSPRSLSFPLPVSCSGLLDCQCDTCWLQHLEDEFSASSQDWHKQATRLHIHHSASSEGAVGTTGPTSQQFQHQAQRNKTGADNDYSKDATDDTTNNTLNQADADSRTDEGRNSDTNNIATPSNQHAGNLSENSSATATQDDGDLNNDEIDFDENDFNIDRDVTDSVAATANTKLSAPLDEEISWESENEDAHRHKESGNIQSSEQVSTTPGKRTRSGSDAAMIASDRKDVKRQRS